MEVYVARQPIFTASQEVVAYELLYRSNKENFFTGIDGDQATSDVLNSFLQIGVEELSEGKPCFVNFTETWLDQSIPSYLPPEMIVIEVLETVTPTDQVIKNCERLKAQGYTIALDDFELDIDHPNSYRLLELADIVKVDVRDTTRTKQLEILSTLQPYELDFLAEKVETREEFEQCVEDGYCYFQGYFFSKPVILSTSDVPISNHHLAFALKELSEPEPDLNKVTEIIERDLSLAYKLLKLINSPGLRRVSQIKSIKQAIMLLGFRELRKWMFLLSLGDAVIGKDGSSEVIKMCFIRARACERIAQKTGKTCEASSYFLIGLFSLIDTLMKQPLDHVLDQLSLEEELKETIKGVNTPYSQVYDLVLHIERAEWDEIDRLTEAVGLSQHHLFDIYKEAVKWTTGILEGPLQEV